MPENNPRPTSSPPSLSDSSADHLAAAAAAGAGSLGGAATPESLRPKPAPMGWRVLWLLAGIASLLLGIIGIFVPLLPTTPLVLLAAFCFSRGSTRCERWLLEHRVFGPMVRDWRATRAVPLRAKQLASVMMAFGSITAAFKLPLSLAWLPAACCACVAWWLWRLPTRKP